MVAEFSGPMGPPTHVDVVDPHTDANGDGVLDTVVVHAGSPLSAVLHDFLDDHSVAVVSDFDGDARADHLTTFEDDGGYASWQLTSGDDPAWTLTDKGSL